ncbi:MAG: putative zinc-binding peptidase [Xanthobacteraceae bacterium]|nr:putative zinc-binding peptidase [Xanthobacteraceae bacterium]
MKLFECQKCNQLLYFENTSCGNCGSRLGYLQARETLSVVGPDGPHWRAAADPTRRYRFCANAGHGACNWLVDDEQPGPYCAACRHNQTVPDLSVPENVLRWRKIEFAKHRLMYSLLKLKLPLATRAEDPDGLAFEFLVPGAAAPDGSVTPVMTGHANGVITININEADDAERERMRNEMGEAYRTLLGHFRHEIGHYYWDRLIAEGGRIEPFRATFGDERRDYTQALQQHYAGGPPADWQSHFVSAYASSHPWEDFAETWAHYFHMVDTVESARAFGLSVRPRLAAAAELATVINFDPHNARVEPIIDAWTGLSIAVNEINRSMGLPDLYPFVLTPAVVDKLTFIHECIHGAAPAEAADRANSAAP